MELSIPKDDEVAFFALLRLRILYDWMKTWEWDLLGIPAPAGVADWKDILEPPPIHCAWACRQGQQENRSRVSIDDGDASSDDEDNMELEPAGETDDADLVNDLDHVIGTSDFLD
ncbi:hypothetical protein BS47DRAFT_1393736 [Hydnum rufescens UP504]|uniref:Uncharacterized protein n=1 Tax=Hydnum rufescens UP504 TaxID=1448309 RepID=A0A9P6DS90_9AGAM|nr:hypothetical protein BS47DRAFT_1393736 [Hydnum rufescens UP504]